MRFGPLRPALCHLAVLVFAAAGTAEAEPDKIKDKSKPAPHALEQV